jgi:hypothetical protein
MMHDYALKVLEQVKPQQGTMEIAGFEDKKIPAYPATVADCKALGVTSISLPMSDNGLDCPPPPSQRPPPAQRPERCLQLINWARCKLIFENDISKSLRHCSAAARTAVVDVRLMLSFEAGRLAAEREKDLISSHLRTVVSVPQNREYIRAGYPSEPILAEAAARQLNYWAKLDRNPMLRILKDDLAHDLLDRGEIGEVVGRSLLIAAHDQATIASHGGELSDDTLLPASVCHSLYWATVLFGLRSGVPRKLPRQHILLKWISIGGYHATRSFEECCREFHPLHQMG